MTDNNFKSAMAMLAATFGRALDAATVQGYSIGLSDLTDEQLAGATAKALRSCKFMPSPSELRDLAGRSLGADMANAWEAVRAAMDRFDYTHSVDFGPLVNAVVRNLGGWVEICSKSLPQLIWVRKDFERVYEAFASTEHAALRGEPLRGAFGGVPERIAIASVTPPLQLPPAPTGASSLVRQLADAKAAP